MTPPNEEKAGSIWMPVLAVLAGPVMVFGPILASGKTLFWGAPLLQFTPWRELALKTLASGELPLWNPLLGMGAPLLANYQSALMYPPNWLILILKVPTAETLLVLLHLIWAGLGMIALIRSMSARPMAQAVGGVAFSMSGYLVARSGFLSINATMAWMPWILLGFRRLGTELTREDGIGRPGRALIGLSGPLAMQWLAGHAQTAWYSLILAGVWGTWELINNRRVWKAYLALTAASLALAFAIAASQLIPTAEYLLLSQRSSAVSRDLAFTYSFWPWRFLGLIMPGLFGSPATGDFWGYGNFWEDALYIGILPLLLALAAGWQSFRGRLKPSPARVLLVLVAFVLVLALGDNSPVFPFLYDHVPTFSLFQAPTRWNLITVFVLSILASFGADVWRNAEGRSLYWLRLLTAGSGMIAAAALVGAVALPGIRESFGQAFMLAGIAFTLSGVLALIRPHVSRDWWQAGVVAFVVADLVIAGRSLNPAAPVGIHEGASELARQVANGARVYMDPAVEQTLKFHRSFRFDRFDELADWRTVRDWGLPNTPALDGIASANNFDPIRPERFDIWMAEVERASPEVKASLLSLMGVGYAALDLDGEGLPVYEPVSSPGRIRIVERVIPVERQEDALASLLSGDLDFDREAIIEDWPGGEPPAGRGGSAEIIQQGAGALKIGVDVPNGGWLLLSDAWYPGWQARVDGQQAAIHPMDYLFRGVWLNPGSTTVTFTYAPFSFRAGLLLSCIGILTMLGLGVLEWQR